MWGGDTERAAFRKISDSEDKKDEKKEQHEQYLVTIVASHGPAAGREPRHILRGINPGWVELKPETSACKAPKIIQGFLTTPYFPKTRQPNPVKHSNTQLNILDFSGICIFICGHANHHSTDIPTGAHQTQQDATPMWDVTPTHVD